MHNANDRFGSYALWRVSHILCSHPVVISVKTILLDDVWGLLEKDPGIFDFENID